jgi:hypothetical protein
MKCVFPQFNSSHNYNESYLFNREWAIEINKEVQLQRIKI